MKHVRFWKTNCLSLLVLMGFTAAIQAQIPGGAAGAAGAAGGAAGAAGQTKNIWSRLQRTPEQMEACRERFCKSILGKILGAAVKPVAAFTGGLVGGKCQKPLKKDLEKPADSAAGAAARIKQDELEAKQRVQAVRYLATVNCKRWPEAELALINSLRADRNECVRFAAAQAIAHGCCCTVKTAAALSIVVSGSNRDGFPVEDSVRVRNMAMVALDHCLSNCLQPQVPLGPEYGPGETKPGTNGGIEKLGSGNGGKTKVTTASHDKKSAGDAKSTPKKRLEFYRAIDQKAAAPFIRIARQKAAQTPQMAQTVQHSPSQTSGLVEIIGNAFSSSNRSVETYDIPITVPSAAPSYREPPQQSPWRRGLLPALFDR